MRILLVEDEELLCSSLSRALCEECYAVDTASDGDSAVYHAENWSYDAVILDIMLPGCSGWKVLERIRRFSHVPVIMLTALDGLKERITGLDSGADDYITKPFDLYELLARLRAVIRRSQGHSSQIIEINDVCLDTQAKRVTRTGEEIHLTAREYVIFAHLACRKGHTVTRTELYEHLFDEKDDTISNLIDVHISSLSKKLGAELIRTRRGLGYFIGDDL